MQPQTTGVVNTSYFDNLTEQVNHIPSCAGLQPVINEAMASIQAQINALEHQIAALVPIVTIPAANPGAIVGWITNFVQPYTKALNDAQAQLSAQLAAISRLQAALTAAAGRFTDCHISLPTIS